MPSREIQEFAQTLVRQVRDSAIRSCDGLLQPDAGSRVADRWRELGSDAESLRVVVPDAVDETMFSLLSAIDQGLLQLKFVSSDGTEVDLSEEGLGELGGWYMASGGWRAIFSDERFIDDFSDLMKND